MNVSDVKNLVKSVIEKTENITSFNDLYQSYRYAEDKSEAGYKLWQYMNAHCFIPENLDSDGDLDLASVLERIAVDNNEVQPLKYSLVILFHRFILSDILEKAFVSKMLIFFYQYHRSQIRPMLNDFIENAMKETIYASAFDVEDSDSETLLFEMIRAILPIIQWFKRTYPSQELHGISDEYLSLCQNIADKLEHERKPALPKYVAFGRYLYESIHTNTQIVEEDNEEYNEFEQMLNDFINSEFSKLTDKSDNK